MFRKVRNDIVLSGRLVVFINVNFVLETVFISSEPVDADQGRSFIVNAQLHERTLGHICEWLAEAINDGHSWEWIEKSVRERIDRSELAHNRLKIWVDQLKRRAVLQSLIFSDRKNRRQRLDLAFESAEKFWNQRSGSFDNGLCPYVGWDVDLDGMLRSKSLLLQESGGS